MHKTARSSTHECTRQKDASHAQSALDQRQTHAGHTRSTRCARKCLPNSGSLYYNYKVFYSVFLIALVDADYKFIWADIGGMGSASDAQIYNASELKECVEVGSLDFLDPEPLPNDNLDVPNFFVGDDVFALRPDMMKPYSLRGMTRPFAGSALSARGMRASCAGHSFSAPATRCALVDLFKTCALYALCMHTAYVQRASNTLGMLCQLASFF